MIGFIQLLLGLYVAFVAVFVMANYLQHTGSTTRGGRLLPWHVSVIAFSYLIYVVVGVLDAYNIITEDVKNAVRLVAVTFGAVAMSIIVVYVYKKDAP